MNTVVDEARDTVDLPADTGAEPAPGGRGVHPLLPFALLLVIGIGIALVVQGPAFAARSSSGEGGDEVAQQALFGEMDLYREDPDLFQRIYGVPFDSGESGNYTTQDTALVLTSMVLSELVAQVLLDDAGLTEDDLDLESAESDVLAGLGLTPEVLDGYENDDAAEELLDRLTYLFAVGNAVTGAIAAEAGPSVEEAIAEDPEAYTRYCLDVVGGTDRAAVEEAQGAVAGGATIDEVAPATDPTSPVQAQRNACLFGVEVEQQGEIADAILSLEPGGVSDVIEAGPGQFVFFQLASVEEPSADDPDLARLVQESVDVEGRFNEMLTAAYEKADIEVNPRFGTWVPSEDGRYAVQPPEGPLETGEEPVGLEDELLVPVPGDELIVPAPSGPGGS